MTHALAFLNARLGTENLIAAQVHMDETTPHLHALYVPLSADHRLCGSEILGDWRKLSNW